MTIWNITWECDEEQTWTENCTSWLDMEPYASTYPPIRWGSIGVIGLFSLWAIQLLYVDMSKNVKKSKGIASQLKYTHLMGIILLFSNMFFILMFLLDGGPVQRQFTTATFAMAVFMQGSNICTSQCIIKLMQQLAVAPGKKRGPGKPIFVIAPVVILSGFTAVFIILLVNFDVPMKYGFPSAAIVMLLWAIIPALFLVISVRRDIAKIKKMIDESVQNLEQSTGKAKGQSGLSSVDDLRLVEKKLNFMKDNLGGACGFFALFAPICAFTGLLLHPIAFYCLIISVVITAISFNCIIIYFIRKKKHDKDTSIKQDNSASRPLKASSVAPDTLLSSSKG